MSSLSDFVAVSFVCLQDAITAANTAAAPKNQIGHVVMRPGIQIEPDMAQFQDMCCEGYAYLRVMRVMAPEEPTRQEPLGTPISPCGMDSLGAEMELSIFRCAEVGNIDFPVQDDAWNAAYIQLLTDFDTLNSALCCIRNAFAQNHQTWSIVYNDWQPWEVQGACLGSRLQFTATIECPDEDCLGARID